MMETARVHTLAKSRWNPSAVDRSITQAAYSARGIPRWMPVMHDGQVVAAVRGYAGGLGTEVATLTHKQWCGFQDVPDMRQKIQKGKFTRVLIWKDNTTGGTGQNWCDLWNCQGSSAVGGFSGTANTLRQFDNTTPGGLWIGPLVPAASETRHVVGWNLTINSTNRVATMILYDRVATYDGCSITTVLTTLTNTLPPLRYVSAGQEGLLVSVAATTALGAVASTLSAMTFTDNQGNAAVSQSPGYTQNYYTSAGAPAATAGVLICTPFDPTSLSTFTPVLPLAANCSGVRKVETFTASVINTGTTCWSLIHPIAVLPVMGNTQLDIELHKTMRAMERVYDGACLSILAHSANAAPGGMFGHVKMAHG